MQNLGMQMIKAVEARLRGRIAQSEANLAILLENPTGIGEHVDLVEEVYTLVQDITEAKDMLSTTITHLNILNGQKDLTNEKFDLVEDGGLEYTVSNSSSR